MMVTTKSSTTTGVRKGINISWLIGQVLFVLVIISWHEPTTTAVASPTNGKTVFKRSSIDEEASSTKRIQIQESNEDLKKNEKRKDFIKNMAVSAWNAYKKYGWGCGELIYTDFYNNDYRGSCQMRSPLPGRSLFWHGRNVKWMEGSAHAVPSRLWSEGATIVTGLDTMFVMNLTAQFKEGIEWIQDHLHINVSRFPTINTKRTIPTFIGALLSCFYLTKNTVCSTRADQIASYFYSEYSIPIRSRRNYFHSLAYAIPWVENTYDRPTVFSELNIEFHYLSDVTGNETYRKDMSKRVNIINELFYLRPRALFRNAASLDFYELAEKLWPNLTSESGGNYLDYLLKAWLKGGRKDAELRNHLITLADGVANGIIKTRGNFTYVSIFDYPNTSDEGYMAHSLCYLGGWFALAGAALGGTHKERYVKIGENITRTCHEAHLVEPPLPAGYFRVTADRLIVDNETDPGYQLTAQTVESYFILWRITHDQKYRDWGWELAEGIVKHSKDMRKKNDDERYDEGLHRKYDDDEWLPSLLVGRTRYNRHGSTLGQMQHMTLISETLKYLYLLFSDDNYFSLDEWIFNANGHPLPIDGTIPRTPLAN